MTEEKTLSEKVQAALEAAGIDSSKTDIAVTVEYGLFNDPEKWEPLFASGELDESLRDHVFSPIHVFSTYDDAVFWAEQYDESRRSQSRLEKFGSIVVKKRTIIKVNWDAA